VPFQLIPPGMVRLLESADDVPYLAPIRDINLERH